MFYEQANEYVTPRKLAYACLQSYRMGLVVGCLAAIGLCCYWMLNGAITVKYDDAATAPPIPTITVNENLADLDTMGPRRLERGLEGLDYVVRKYYHLKATEEVRIHYGVIFIPVGIILIVGTLALLIILFCGLPSLRLRPLPSY